MTETWEIETGDAARVYVTNAVTMTMRGAVRAARAQHRRWASARPGVEVTTMLCRPGCRPVRILR